MQDDLLDEQPAEAQLSDEGDDVPPKLALDVQIEALGACQRHVRVSIPRTEIDRYLDEVVGKLSNEAIVPGFRPGRAPRKLVERRFRKEVQEQVKRSLLNDSMAQLIEDYDLAPISEPDLDVDKVLLPEAGPMVFEFGLEVRPEFELPQWKGLDLQTIEHEVTEAEIEAELEEILLRHGKLVPTEEPARTGDYVTVNVSFRFGDTLLNQVRDKELKLQPRLVLRDGVLEGFDALMAGARPGERRTGQARASDEIGNPQVRGQQVAVEFEVLDVKRPQLPELDEALLQRLGDFRCEADLRDAIRNALQDRFEFHKRRFIRDQIRTKLLANADWDLPPQLLRRQAQREIERYVLELKHAGYDEKAILAHVNEVRQNILENTRRALQEHFLLERIAEEEGLRIDEADIDSVIQVIAAQQGDSPRRVRARMEKANNMDAVHNLAVEQKVLRKIIDRANFTKVDWQPAKMAAVPLDESLAGEAPPESVQAADSPSAQTPSQTPAEPQP